MILQSSYIVKRKRTVNETTGNRWASPVACWPYKFHKELGAFTCRSTFHVNVALALHKPVLPTGHISPCRLHRLQAERLMHNIWFQCLHLIKSKTTGKKMWMQPMYFASYVHSTSNPFQMKGETTLSGDYITRMLRYWEWRERRKEELERIYSTATQPHLPWGHAMPLSPSDIKQREAVVRTCTLTNITSNKCST